MQGYGLAADVKTLCYGIDVQRLVCDHVDDPAPGGVGNGLEYVSSDYHCASICLQIYGQGFACANIFWKNFTYGDRDTGLTRPNGIAGLVGLQDEFKPVGNVSVFVG